MEREQTINQGSQTEDTGQSGTMVVRPEIQSKMPPTGSKTYVEMGLFEIFTEEVKKFLHGEPNELFP
jgi:hypothetical protein